MALVLDVNSLFSLYGLHFNNNNNNNNNNGQFIILFVYSSFYGYDQQGYDVRVLVLD